MACCSQLTPSTEAHDTLNIAIPPVPTLAIDHHITAPIHDTAAEDIVVLLDLPVEKEDTDVHLLVSIKEEVLVDDALEALLVEDVVEAHHLLFTTIMIGIMIEEEEEEEDPLLHLSQRKIETEEQYSSLSSLLA